MTDHTTNMLAAFHLAVHTATVIYPTDKDYDVDRLNIEIVDVAVARAGETLFGKGWTAVKRAPGGPYAPLVSMTLGRMRAAGLVRAGAVSLHDGLRYRSWAFTDEGVALAERMFGSAEDLAAAFAEPVGV